MLRNLLSWFLYGNQELVWSPRRAEKAMKQYLEAEGLSGFHYGWSRPYRERSVRSKILRMALRSQRSSQSAR